ncbi:MAG: c-type cytochrome, partial [Gemmataceae bacterium]|nr:c-type cytochrome [Gemmataceae bacterium]
EVAIAQRLALENIPDWSEFTAAEKAVEDARRQQARHQKRLDELRQKIRALQPDKERSEAKFQAIKSELESRLSFYDLEVEKHGVSPVAKRYLDEAKVFADELDKEQGKRDEYVGQIRELRAEADSLEKDLTDKLSALKKLHDRFDTQVKIAVTKQWSIADSIRNLPIIDGFASPIRIHQITNNDIPIDYNFKYVTRFDRCTSCHLGIDRPAYTKEMLRSLVDTTSAQEGKLTQARTLLLKRKQTLEGLPEAQTIPDPDQLELFRLPKSQLTEARIAAFAAHPRLDLFVSSTSKHPMEKFGCSACHYGQGSATSFALASHTPDDPRAKERWVAEHGWELNHMWDFPMLPQRFTESSCLKCHYEITDLYSADGRVEAPKLLRGYHLIREFGCFGCHEIHGRKGGRDIGPDLRLEPSPPLEMLSPLERTKILSDPDTAPGRLRKVGPSLARLSEKIPKAEWLVKWLRAPRDFRPDTKMPHFYGLSNNDPKFLPDEQKSFPDAEMWAIAEYLLEVSKQHLTDIKTAHQELAEKDGPAKAQADLKLVEELQAKNKLDDADKARLEAAQRRIALRSTPLLIDPTNGYPGDPDQGRLLFTERGCLACHSHAGTATDEHGVVRKGYLPISVPAAVSDAQFGPNLSQIPDKFLSADVQQSLAEAKGRRQEPAKRLAAAHKELTEAQGAYDLAKSNLEKAQADSKDKLKKDLDEAQKNLEAAKQKHAQTVGDYQQAEERLLHLLARPDVTNARVWLTSWILNPQAHSPRTRMPITHLTPHEAADIASWLLAQKSQDLGEGWTQPVPERPSAETLKNLARVYLVRILSKTDMNKLLAGQKLSPTVINDLPKDEQYLANNFNDDALVRYVGKKAVARLGCFACHDIPGLENLKPIGVGLNDWGKKPADRLAFEDIANFVKQKYHIVDSLTDANGKPIAAKDKDGKEPYDKFFADLLEHHHRSREGYLHQKLVDPRSYDYLRIRTWDDRARMPQFRFARLRKKPGESARDFEARQYKEEADAREAVMTFILGLVAEQVPLKSTNQPTGDRLAEVKGRQVLDNFNCAGCHLIRPGVFDFKINR